MRKEEEMKKLDDTITTLYYKITFKEESYLKQKNINLTLNEVKTINVISKTEDKSISGLSQALNVTPGTFSVSVDKLISKGYIKRINDEYDKRKVLIDITSKSIPILQISLNGTLIKEWKSQTEACNQLGLDMSGLSHCLRGYRMRKDKRCPIYSYHGYKWKYKE